MERISNNEATPHVSIEGYREADKEAIVAGIADLQEVERAVADTRRPGSEVAEQYVRELQEKLTQKQGALFVAREQDRVAGFIACWIEREENIAETEESNVYGYICDAYVAPQYRGKGVFQKLNDRAEAYLARFPEVRLVRITVLAENASAVKAYEKAGYRPEEIRLMKKMSETKRTGQ